MLVRVGRSVRLPVRLLTSNGVPAIGILPADIEGGICRLTFANGEHVDVTLTNNVNWFEMLPGTGNPGMYHVLVDKTILTSGRKGPFQWSVMPAGGGSGIGTGVIGGLTTTGIGDGDFVYVSAANTVSKTDAAVAAKSELFGAGTPVAGEVQITGVVEHAKFTTAQGQPGNGTAVYLARAADDSSTGAGKLRATPPIGSGEVIAEVGIVLDNTNWTTLKTCRVLLQAKKPVANP